MGRAHTGEGVRRGTGPAVEGGEGGRWSGRRIPVIGRPAATKLRIEVQNPTKSCITRFMHETWMNRERAVFAGDTPPSTSAFVLEPARRTRASRPAWTATAGGKTPRPRVAARRPTSGRTRPSGRPRWSTRRRGRSGQFEGVDRPPRTGACGRPGHSRAEDGPPVLCASLQGRDAIAVDSGHAAAPGSRRPAGPATINRRPCDGVQRPGCSATPSHAGQDPGALRAAQQKCGARLSPASRRPRAPDTRPAEPRTPSPQALPYRR